MINPSRLHSAKAKIVSYFSEASKTLYLEAELRGIFNQHREYWRLAKNTKLFEFIEFLVQHTSLEHLKLHSKQYGLSINRYSWGKATPLELALSIKARGYLCHGTALTLHGLTKFPSKTIYLNTEQSAKPPNAGVLTQNGIDLAFSRKQRQSKLVYDYDGGSITMIAGKNTNRLGVEQIIGPTGEKLEVTDLERTLIDIVVRPTYAGGQSTILQAYRSAKDLISIDRLLQMLDQLDYLYPYHQAIGYLMQKTSYPEATLNRLRQKGLKHDFYLSHGIKNSMYSQEWRIFYPKN